MKYTISEVSKKTSLSISTLRYYDNEGLFLNLEKGSNGNRIFDDNNINTLKLIECLKNSGLKIKEIKDFISLCTKGNSSLEARYNFFINQEIRIKDEINKLQYSLDLVHYKEWYYKSALKLGDEKFALEQAIINAPDEIKDLYKNIHI